jgi:hypothetical protein
MSTLQTEYSLLFIVPCLVLAFLYAWFLYQKEAPWNKALNRGLAALRFIVVFFTAMLLLGPYAKQLLRTAEKPVVAIAVDNSQSMSLVNEGKKLQATQQRLIQMTESLTEAGVEPGGL